MLIKNYILQTHKVINHEGFLNQTPTDFILRVKNAAHRTLKEHPLKECSPNDLQILFQEQQDLMEKELTLLLKFKLISRPSATITRQQYYTYYVHTIDNVQYLFKKADILKDTSHELKVANTRVHSPEPISYLPPDNNPPPTQPTQPTTTTQDDLQFIFNHQVSPLSDQQVIGISVTSIRNITGFSYFTTPAWSESQTPVFIEWQKQMIEDTSNILVINGSRQMGKSYGISELLIEESFIPGADILVAAFLQKTTNAILNYMRKFMVDFSEEDFTVYKKDGYIQNNHTGVCIHFRTLGDGGANVLGLTLRLIVVDEAQLITIEVFDDVLKPTMTTTGGRLVMIGTSIEDTSSYMFQTITEIAKGEKYNNHGQKTARLITVSADNNPLIHPLERTEIYTNKDSPAIQRQYFNVWGKLSDSLFQPQYIQPQDFFTTSNEPSTITAHLLYGIDPARRADRSGWSVTIVEGGNATVIKSGEVPEHLKKDWDNQAMFHMTQLAALKVEFPRATIKTVMDLTGLGDGVLIIFRNKGLVIDFKVQYTSGFASSQPMPTQYHVAKSLMINNILDLTEGKRLRVIQPLNKLLEEEFKYVRLKETRTGQMGMESAFFDDITNSLMIALFISKEMGYLYRMTNKTQDQSQYNMMTEDRKRYDVLKKKQAPLSSGSHF